MLKSDKIAVIQQSLSSFDFFGRNCLKVLSKDGELMPFIMNPAQRIIHEALEKQRAEKGYVRAIVLKSRRVGCSTLIAARFYRYASLMRGKAVAIVAHINQTTGALYDIVKRFQAHSPIAPNVGSSNIKQLKFDKLDSQYSVFSAENEEAGRGQGFQYLHASEFAMWSKPEAQLAGIFKAVPLRADTEIIIESTAAGPQGAFYEMCQDAMRGIGPYQFIFVPFTIDPDCALPVPPDWKPEAERIVEDSPSEVELMEQFGLKPEQLVWRRAEMGGPRNIRRFLREFPLTPQDAFNSTSESALINPADIIRARKASVPASGPKVLGVDPAGSGKDRFAIACRQGNVVLWVQHRTKVTFNEAVAWIKALAEQERPTTIYIDAAGGGNGSALCSAFNDDPGMAKLIRPVNFGGRSQTKLGRPDKPGPLNRRAEMYSRLADWLSGDAAVKIPDDEALHQDLLMARVKELAGGDWRLESKDGEISPDLADAVALTFADKYVALPQELGVSQPLHAGYPAPSVTHGARSWMV